MRPSHLAGFRSLRLEVLFKPLFRLPSDPIPGFSLRSKIIHMLSGPVRPLNFDVPAASILEGSWLERWSAQFGVHAIEYPFAATLALTSASLTTMAMPSLSNISLSNFALANARCAHESSTNKELGTRRRRCAKLTDKSSFFLRENRVPVIPIGFRNRFLAFAPTIAGGRGGSFLGAVSGGLVCT